VIREIRELRIIDPCLRGFSVPSRDIRPLAQFSQEFAHMKLDSVRTWGKKVRVRSKCVLVLCWSLVVWPWLHEPLLPLKASKA
jgi:hypothetical protein